MDTAFTTGRLAALTGATCEGDPERPLHGVASLSTAGPTDVSFCSGGRWERALPSTRAGAVFLGAGSAPDDTIVLRHREPRLAFAVAAAAMVPVEWPEPGVHPTAWVHPTATVRGATIGPFAAIEAGVVVGEGSWVMSHAAIGRDVRIGARCRVFPHAVLMDRITVGDRVWVHPGAVIGADGFGHVPTRGTPVRVPQLGTVVIEDDVEVGANACVDRAALDETRIGRASRLDNLVQVAHGVRIGASCLLAAFAGVAGGARLGDRVVMAGRTAVVDGIDVGDDVTFAGLASASRDVPAGARLGGSPARRYQQWLREMAALRQLPEWSRVLGRLERRVRTLEETR